MVIVRHLLAVPTNMTQNMAMLPPTPLIIVKEG